MVGISMVEIWEDGMKVFAKVTRFDKTEEIVRWNNTKERIDVLRHIDGYTLIEDKRLQQLKREV